MDGGGGDGGMEWRERRKRRMGREEMEGDGE